MEAWSVFISFRLHLVRYTQLGSARYARPAPPHDGAEREIEPLDGTIKAKTTERLTHLWATVRPWLILLGATLTVMGYESRNGDQAYRLPLLLHRHDPTLFADDPFVAAFATFNPHAGYLALLDASQRVVGLSATLFLGWVCAFGLTAFALARIARWVASLSPTPTRDAGLALGLTASALAMIDRAGNIGTNHVFASMLLDRMIAHGLGWSAAALWITGSWQAALCGPVLIGAAAWIHPALGLQWGMVLGACWIIEALGGSRLRPCRRSQPHQSFFGRGPQTAAVLTLVMLSPNLAALPSQSRALLEGLDPQTFLILSAWIQSPQHMLPGQWRFEQWAAFGCHGVLAVPGLVTLVGALRRGDPRAGRLILLGVVLGLFLLASWVAVVVMEDLKATLFQPFRMATAARVWALVLIACHVAGLWNRRTAWGRVRAVLIAAGLTGDWRLVTVTLAESAAWLTERVRGDRSLVAPGWAEAFWLGVLGGGLLHLLHHDTRNGASILGGTLVVWMGVEALIRRHTQRIDRESTKEKSLPRWEPLSAIRPRPGVWLGLAWLVPGAAWCLQVVTPASDRADWPIALTARWRFLERPIDDEERLAWWCRTHLPAEARLVTPPGPKSIRLWSQRSVVFNRAGGPYHARGLAEWAERFRLHVGFEGDLQTFAAAYLNNRVALESRYDKLTDRQLADLARKFNATHVWTRTNAQATADSPLILLKTIGRHRVYRVREDWESLAPPESPTDGSAEPAGDGTKSSPRGALVLE